MFVRAIDEFGKELVAKLEKWRAACEIPPELISCGLHEDVFTGMLTAMLTEEVLAIKYAAELKVAFSWWDAVKERFAPRCFLRHWPVRNRTYDAAAYFQNIPVELWRILKSKPLTADGFRWKEREQEEDEEIDD